MLDNILFKTSTIQDGNMSFRFDEDLIVIKNRQHFLANNDIYWKQHLCMKCSHGDVITVVNSLSPGVGADSQASMLESEVLITQDLDLTLMLLTADCLPTAFYDPASKTIALAHMSRQTIAEGLPRKTIEFLVKTFDTDPSKLEVSVGPYIHKESYLLNNTGESFGEKIAPYTEKSKDKIAVDLAAAHNNELIKAGVLKSNINLSEVDTFSSPEHFSHYESTRDNQKPHGRLATILKLES